MGHNWRDAPLPSPVTAEQNRDELRAYRDTIAASLTEAYHEFEKSRKALQEAEAYVKELREMRDTVAAALAEDEVEIVASGEMGAGSVPPKRQRK